MRSARPASPFRRSPASPPQVLALQAELAALDKQHAKSVQAQLTLQAEVRELRAEREARVREVLNLRRCADRLLAERQAAAVVHADDVAYIRQLESRLAALDLRSGSAARRRALAETHRAIPSAQVAPDERDLATEVIERERARSRRLAENLLDANTAAEEAAADSTASTPPGLMLGLCVGNAAGCCDG
jgi:hypothetical protein